MGGALLFSMLLFWVLPIVIGQMIGRRKNRKGWAWGFFLGWIGVLIVALLGAKVPQVVQHQHQHIHVMTPAPTVAPTATELPATIALPAKATAPAPTLPPAGWYNDPQVSGSMRWWDGTTWTSFTAPSAAAASTGGLSAS